jgi:DNA-binding CsgD family transcriptional regulator
MLVVYSATTLNEFFDRAFRILPQAVKCDYVSAFYRQAGNQLLKERDSRGRVWGGAFMRRYSELTPAIPFALANPGVKVIATRFGLAVPEAELRRTAFYREVMQRQGWRHAVALCFWPAGGAFPVLVLSLYRTEKQPDFTRQELDRLEQLHAFLSPVVTRFHQLSTVDAVSAGIATALRHLSCGIVVLDSKLRLVRTNAAGRRACAEWNHAWGQRERQIVRGNVAVPRALLQVCDELCQELQMVMRRHPDADAERRRRVTHPVDRGRGASVTGICHAVGMSEPSFVIEFDTEKRSRVRGGDTESLLRRLTGSEREVALVVAEGLSNDEAAERLGKTVHAVKFLLHRIYHKLGVPNRARLAVMLRAEPP